MIDCEFDHLEHLVLRQSAQLVSQVVEAQAIDLQSAERLRWFILVALVVVNWQHYLLALLVLQLFFDELLHWQSEERASLLEQHLAHMQLDSRVWVLWQELESGNGVSFSDEVEQVFKLH